MVLLVQQGFQDFAIYHRLESYISPLISRGLVKSDFVEGKTLFSLTPEGLDVLHQIEEILSKLRP
jgi:predicted transcriptional regulator